MRKLIKPKKKYQDGGKETRKIPSAPADYKEMAFQMGKDTTRMTMSPIARDIAAKKHLANTNYQGDDAFYRSFPVQGFVEHIGDPLEGPRTRGYNPMRRSTMEYLYNLPNNFDSMQEAQDSLQQYKKPTPYQYGGEHPMLAPPVMPNMPNRNAGANVFGGALSGAGLGAKLGTVVPGVGNVIGGIVGGAAGAIGGIFKNGKQRRAGEALMDNYQDQLGGYQNALLGQNYMPQLNIPTFKQGGQMTGNFKDELLNGPTNAEVENDEVIQSPMGEMATMSGPTHEQGGIDVSMDPGDRVYSDELKDDDGKTFAEKADKARKSTKKYEKVLEDPRSTKLAKFTANKMLQKLSGQLDQLFQKQESMKPQQAMPEGPIDAPDMAPQFQDGGLYGGFNVGNMFKSLANRPNLGINQFNPKTVMGGDSPLMGGMNFTDFAKMAVPGVADTTATDGGYSWGNLLGDAATYAPAGYNLLKGAFGAEPDIQFDANRYTGYNEVTPRRTSLNPIRRDIEARERASNRAITNVGTDTTGGTYSRMAANAADSKRAMANAAMTEEQAYNSADMQAQLANQQAAMNSNQMGMQGALNYENMRQRALAVPGAHLTAGLTQVSDIAQSRKLMENQRFRDTQRAAALEGYSPMYGYDEDGMGFGTQTDPYALNRRKMKFLSKPIRKGR